MADKTPETVTPAVDAAALQSELSALKDKIKDFDGTANELSALKALLERAKADPDEALALSGHDFESFSEGIIQGKLRPRTKAEREAAKAKQEEVSEIEKLRKRNKELEDAENAKQAKATYDQELAFLDENLPEDEFPLLRTLGLNATVLKEWYEDREADPEKKNPDLKAVAKRIQDRTAASASSLLKNPKALAVLFSDPAVLDAIREHIPGATKATVKKISSAIIGAGEVRKKEGQQADPSPPRADSQEERDRRSIERLLAKAKG